MKSEYKLNSRYEILTADGFKQFSGISLTEVTGMATITLSNGNVLKCSLGHRWVTPKGKVKTADLVMGDLLVAEAGTIEILSIDINEVIFDAYDIIEVDKEHSFFVNGVLSSNCDEFAFVKPHVSRQFYDSILPTISTGGAMIISSTPNGDVGQFAELWRGANAGLNEFQHGITYVPWNAPPGRDEEFKKKFMGLLGERKWRQEYECEFLTEELTLIDSALVTQAESRVNELIEAGELVKFAVNDNRFVFYKKLVKDAIYMVGVDPCTGAGSDNGVFQVFEFPSMEQVLEYTTNTLSPQIMYTELKSLLTFLEQASNEIYFSIENNGVGQGIIAAWEGDMSPPSAMFVSENGKVGVNSNTRTKLRACLQFKEAFERGKITINSPDLLKELKSFVRSRGSYAAQIGATDDRIMALIVIFYIIQEISTSNASAYDMVYTVAEEIERRHSWKPENEQSNQNDDPQARSDLLSSYFDSLHGVSNSGILSG